MLCVVCRVCVSFVRLSLALLRDDDAFLAVAFVVQSIRAAANVRVHARVPA